MARSGYVHGEPDDDEVSRLVRQARFVATFSLDTFEAPPGARVLDVGTGVGAMAAQLARLCPGIDLTGVDISEAQLARARALHPVATYVRADAACLPFADGSFDRVHMSWVLEHVRDLDDLFASLREATTDDAVLIHKVDLRSHGFHLTNDLDFLRFPVREWDAMTSHTGEPNRLRASDYLHLARRHGFAVAHFSAARTLPRSAVERVRPELAEPFASMSVDELSVVGIWLVLVREKHPLAATALQGVPERIPAAPVGLSSY